MRQDLTFNGCNDFLPIKEDVICHHFGAPHQVLPVVDSLKVNVHQHAINLGHGALKPTPWHRLVTLSLTQGLCLQSLKYKTNTAYSIFLFNKRCYCVPFVVIFFLVHYTNRISN